MTSREKIDAAVRYLNARGVSAAPPLYRLLWALGLYIPPPKFQSFLGIWVVQGPLFGIVAAAISQVYDFGVEPLVAAGIAAGIGVLYGALGALMHRTAARRLGLPKWADFDPNQAPPPTT